MAVSYRSFALVPRLRLARPRSIAPLLRFYSEAASAATAPAPAPAAAPEAPIAADSAPAPTTPAAPTSPEAPATETPPAPASPAISITPRGPGRTPSLQSAIATYKTSRDPEPSKIPTSKLTYKPATSQYKPATPTKPQYKVIPPKANPPKANPPAASPAKKDAETAVDDAKKPPVWRPNVAPNFKSKPFTDNVDWVTSYAGLGTSPVSQAQFHILTQGVDAKDVEIKPDGILYLPEIQYRRRLHEAFGPMGWGIVPRGDAVIGKDIVTREYALIANGCFVSQAQGVNNYFSAESIPTAIEGAKSNALMRCCKDLGIASELWLPEYIRWFNQNYRSFTWVEHMTTKKKRAHYYKTGTEPGILYPWKKA